MIFHDRMQRFQKRNGGVSRTGHGGQAGTEENYGKQTKAQIAQCLQEHFRRRIRRLHDRFSDCISSCHADAVGSQKEKQANDAGYAGAEENTFTYIGKVVSSINPCIQQAVRTGKRNITAAGTAQDRDHGNQKRNRLFQMKKTACQKIHRGTGRNSHNQCDENHHRAETFRQQVDSAAGVF